MTRMSFVYWLGKRTYSKIFVRKNKIKLNNSLNVDLSKGPMLLLSNHCGAHDPIVISAVFPKLVRWVCGAYLLKSPLLRIVFKYLAKCIGKQQGQSDLSSIREIQRSLKKGDIVGLFPEGTRTWDGEMMPLSVRPLAKMVRMFKVPTLLINLEGAYAFEPRWADKKRSSGGITVNIKGYLSRETIEKSTLEDLEKEITENLSFSNDVWKQAANYDYKSDFRAKGVQRLLYMCPECGKVGTIKAEGNKIFCTECGLETVLDDKDNLVPPVKGMDTLAHWHKWESKAIAEVERFNSEKGVLLQFGQIGDNRLKTISKDISVSMKNKKMRVMYKEKNGKRHILVFPYEKVSSLILNAKQTMELCIGNNVYRVRLLPDSSSLKYHESFLCK